MLWDEVLQYTVLVTHVTHLDCLMFELSTVAVARNVQSFAVYNMFTKSNNFHFL